jgi:hypothetical protein
VCLVLSLLPFVDTLALYLLPLGYLRWISLALFVIALLSYLGGGALKKASRYVQYGNAGFGRVVELIKYPSVLMHGQPTMHAFRAIIQVLHPNSDQPVLMEVKSGDFSSERKDGVETRFQVGDFVPVVWLPNNFEKTFQIYDFLEVMPAASLKRDSTAAKKPLWQFILLAISVPGLLFVLFWNVYALGRYMPLEFNASDAIWPAVAGGLLGLIAVVAGWMSTRKRPKRREQRNTDAAAAGKAIEVEHRMGMIRKCFYGLLIVAGSTLLCAGTFLCWCFTANAVFDRSPITTKNVRITDMIQTTHDFIIRDYRLKYRFPDKQKDDELLTTPDHLTEFDAPIGMAEIQSGWLGWPWVKTVRPVKIADVLPNKD